MYCNLLLSSLYSSLNYSSRLPFQIIIVIARNLRSNDDREAPRSVPKAPVGGKEAIPGTFLETFACTDEGTAFFSVFYQGVIQGRSSSQA